MRCSIPDALFCSCISTMIINYDDIVNKLPWYAFYNAPNTFCFVKRRNYHSNPLFNWMSVPCELQTNQEPYCDLLVSTRFQGQNLTVRFLMVNERQEEAGGYRLHLKERAF